MKTYQKEPQISHLFSLSLNSGLVLRSVRAPRKVLRRAALDDVFLVFFKGEIFEITAWTATEGAVGQECLILDPHTPGWSQTEMESYETQSDRR